MLEIVGVKEGSEYEAATHLAYQLKMLWPDITQSRGDQVKIFAGMKMHGRRIEDLDLVVLGRFGDPRAFGVECEFHPRNGERFIPKTAEVRNLALVIEVKGHDPSGVHFDDTVASVRYRRNGKETWQTVTEKNRDQMFEFKYYLADHGIHGVYVQNLVFFTGLREDNLPKRPHNFFGIDASVERILNILGQVSGPIRKGRHAVISAGSDDMFKRALDPKTGVLARLEPSALDRRRMDSIAKGGVPETWLRDVGEKQVTIRGRGGVGKTVVLLQLAYRAFDQNQLRSLVLTYNRALVADLKRTMALLGVPEGLDRGGISVTTVHSLVRTVLKAVGLLDDDEDRFLEKYEDSKARLLEYIKAGAISSGDIEDVKRGQPFELDWDAVFVDEAQDWPENEIEILRHMYGAERLVIADGVDQFVRKSIGNWSSGIDKKRRKTQRMTKCLRMKANLTAFVGRVAKHLGLNEWDLAVNREANGGQVVVIEGDLTGRADVYEEFRASAEELGNDPIDLLACVPPSLVRHDGARAESVIGREIVSRGGNVWDGTGTDVRRTYPVEKDALRIVQYDSCRGLEGWSVINYALDDLWRYKYREGLESVDPVDELGGSREDLAAVFASRWVMIPLTRAMDTLVINIRDGGGPVRDALNAAYQEYPDFVEWRSL
ncbi:DEAD/DEAH box helicase family protein [Halofilum ochraceum]|uniref:DEAD/DEAH box helicase family protein n=1 Tax=Halofilum ochraceum TaxID=1611323 RepID=UPI0008D9FC45|nr:DEAD/DEAH box helicase family protein [Halofilum ochraceum]